MDRNRDYRNIYQKAPDIALTVMLVLAFAGIGLISYYAVTGTYLIRRFDGQESVYIADDPVRQLAVFGIFLAAVLVTGFLWDRLCRDKERIADLILNILSVLSIVIGLAFLLHHPYYMDGDQINTFYAAVYAADEGSSVQYAMFSPGGYIGIYPQQKGLVFFYYLLYHVVGDKMFDSVQYLHLLYPAVIMHAGYHALEEEGISPFARAVYCIMIFACFPMYLYIPYMYGDLGAVAFTAAFVFFFIKYLNTARVYHVLGMCLCGSIALLMRMQIWILLIAAFLVLLVTYMRKRKPLIFVTGVCILAAAFLANMAVGKFFEKKSGYKDVEGVPALCWVAMGLQETNGDPGVYNRYNQGTFEANGFDADKTSAAAKEEIGNRIDALKDDKEHAKWFFETKLRQEWTAPDMEGISMTSVWDTLSGTDPIAAPAWLDELYRSGPLYEKLINLANRYQAIVYLSAALLAVLMFFRKKSEMPYIVQLGLIYFLGGLIFFTLWENKARYILPYFMALIWMVPYAVDELRKIFKRKNGHVKVRNENFDI